MLFRRRSAASVNAARPGPSRVAAGAELRGQLDVPGDLVVGGRVVGDVEAGGSVTVPAGGEVQGTVHARIVSVAGRVTGPVVADERIEIVAGGAIDGDLTSPHVVVADGAGLHGKVDVVR
jgi:cytoskeletal protein CcmA (bactofilin family)